jgi:hypothetical protein
MLTYIQPTTQFDIMVFFKCLFLLLTTPKLVRFYSVGAMNGWVRGTGGIELHTKIVILGCGAQTVPMSVSTPHGLDNRTRALEVAGLQLTVTSRMFISIRINLCSLTIIHFSPAVLPSHKATFILPRLILLLKRSLHNFLKHCDYRQNAWV